MGFKNLFFKSKKEKEHVNDFNPIDVNSVIEAYKKNNPKATEKDIIIMLDKLNKPDEDQEHLTAEGDLPWGWYTINKEFIHKMEAEYHSYFDAWFNTRFSDPRIHLPALQEFVLYMANAKIKCDQKNECFQYWFSSVIATEDYIESRKAELKDLMQNFDSYCTKFDKKQQIETNVVSDLRNKLIKVIEDNPNIKQTDVYAMYDPDAKNYISEELYYMEKENIITRNKEGRTYILNIK